MDIRLDRKVALITGGSLGMASEVWAAPARLGGLWRCAKILIYANGLI